ncbi:ABC transporter permease [Puerhibacterium puerhi]|uniref:ABC transporter permease n=1 Tax=Puerhibacterium puerhi TaxID=2692623 RepID=UPI00135A5192|nr:ABC transporter permease subunit [Puerhibacterium puerhi]
MSLRTAAPPVPLGQPDVATPARPQPGREGWARALRKDWRLYSLAVLPLLFFLIFKYVPMAGAVIAFRRFQPGGSIFGEEWVGLYYVERFIQDPKFWDTFANTAIIGALTLVVVFPLPVVLALMLNEVRVRWFKKAVQTVSYLPHFMSVVIVAGFVFELTSLDGTVNKIVEALGGDPVSFMQRAEWFRTIYVSSEVWQTVGWGTILYLAALTTIDEQLYEASRIDGANRWKQTWHITLPGIRPTMMVLLILNIGQFMAVGFEKVFLLYNPLTYPTADVLSTYVYRVGLTSGQLSYATAIGLFEALIGLVLVFAANAISRRITGSSLW